MGGVDLLDRFLSEYRPRLHSKKWWWCLFANFLNMSVVAGWRIHKVVGGTLSLLEFRRQIVRTLLGKVSDKAARPGPSRMPVDSIRLSGTLQYMFVFLLANKADASSAKVILEASVSSAMCCFTMAALKPFMQTLTKTSSCQPYKQFGKIRADFAVTLRVFFHSCFLFFLLYCVFCFFYYILSF